MTAKTKAPPKLSKAAAAVRVHLEETGDFIAAQIAGTNIYWSFTRSGLPVRGRDVRELKAAGLIEAFGAEIDPDGPAACYVLTGGASGHRAALGTLSKAARPKGASCGAESVQACDKGGFCVDCMPRDFCERIRSGENHLPKNWHGPRP